MNEETARALFERALDGELSPGEQAAFDAALQKNAELRQEYAALQALREKTAWLNEESALPRVDLLAGVQEKLRTRSGGKFYRDRFAERRGLGGVPWMLVLSSLVLVLVSAFFVLYVW